MSQDNMDTKNRNDDEILLQTRDLVKKFGGLTAVNKINLKVKKRQISSLIGPNGAGKTTVFNVVTGIYQPNGGSVIFKGENLFGKKPHEIIKKGIARTFQNIRLFSNMTCLENVMAGQHCRSDKGTIASIFKNKLKKKKS